MNNNSIVIGDGGIRITEVEVPGRDVAQFFAVAQEEERHLLLIQAIEVGTFCLERARGNSDMEFVRRQVDGLLTKVQLAVAAIPETTQNALLAKIGTGDGQLLAPIKGLIAEASQSTSARLNDVRTLLSQDLDPSRDSSTIAKALQKLRDLLDPKRTDSVQSSIEGAIRAVAAENGTLASAVRAVVGQAITPLATEVKDLAKEVRGREAASEALEQTTAKGLSYEEEVILQLQSWAKMAGAEIHHVGGDNQPGDILVKIIQNSFVGADVSIIIEVRDRQSALGRKGISDALTRSMTVRKAQAGVYLSRTREGLAKEIADWAEGTCDNGHFVACTHEHLITALRWLVVLTRLQALQADASETDAASVQAQVQRIRISLDRVKNINRKATEARGSAQGIQEEAELLRDEIRSALLTIEEAVQILPGTKHLSDSISRPAAVANVV